MAGELSAWQKLRARQEKNLPGITAALEGSRGTSPISPRVRRAARCSGAIRSQRGSRARANETKKRAAEVVGDSGGEHEEMDVKAWIRGVLDKSEREAQSTFQSLSTELSPDPSTILETACAPSPVNPAVSAKSGGGGEKSVRWLAWLAKGSAETEPMIRLTCVPEEERRVKEVSTVWSPRLPIDPIG